MCKYCKAIKQVFQIILQLHIQYLCGLCCFKMKHYLLTDYDLIVDKSCVQVSQVIIHSILRIILLSPA